MQKHSSQDGLEMKTGAARESHDLLRAHCEATGTDTGGEPGKQDVGQWPRMEGLEIKTP